MKNLIKMRNKGLLFIKKYDKIKIKVLSRLISSICLFQTTPDKKQEGTIFMKPNLTEKENGV